MLLGRSTSQTFPQLTLIMVTMTKTRCSIGSEMSLASSSSLTQSIARAMPIVAMFIVSALFIASAPLFRALSVSIIAATFANLPLLRHHH
jgi:hypothetical protein